jgi:hypothetical protein
LTACATLRVAPNYKLFVMLSGEPAPGFAGSLESEWQKAGCAPLEPGLSLVVRSLGTARPDDDGRFALTLEGAARLAPGLRDLYVTARGDGSGGRGEGRRARAPRGARGPAARPAGGRAAHRGRLERRGPRRRRTQGALRRDELARGL